MSNLGFQHYSGENQLVSSNWFSTIIDSHNVMANYEISQSGEHMNLMIKTEHLTKEYDGNKVVDYLDLRVNPAATFGFLGPNGAGKTTTIRILTTLTKPTSGNRLSRLLSRLSPMKK